jgi:hypothetical protein
LRSRITVATVLSALTAILSSVPAASPADGESGARSLVCDPPRVKDVSVQLLGPPEDRALLVVRYDPGQHLPPRLTLLIGRQKVVVRDDGEEGDPHAGDDTYTGRVVLDVAALRRHQEEISRLEAATPGGLRFPVFKGRAKVRDVPVESIDLQRLAGGQLTLLPLTNFASTTVDIERSLMITDPSVVTDPTRTYDPCTGGGAGLGRWTFGYLMQQMAGTQDAATFVRTWMKQWETARTVNGFQAKERTDVVRLLAAWPRTTTADGPLDLAKAPFRLLAIVNRIDLAEQLVYGSGKGGELRFVFGATLLQDDPSVTSTSAAAAKKCADIDFTVIFEYGIQRQGCEDLRDWARQWLDLAKHPIDSGAYRTALEAITEQLVPKGSAPAALNQSALNQLRTNEIALADLSKIENHFWDMREFHLCQDATAPAGSASLCLVPVARTPDLSFNHTATLASFVNANAAAIEQDQQDVPTSFNGAPFQAATARMDPHEAGRQGTFWKGPATPPTIASNEARYHFSLNTCNGCHAGETSTRARHVLFATKAVKASPSSFLTGITLPDPVDPSVPREFNDLQRRQLSLIRQSADCVQQIAPNVMSMEH